ncbi:hypothetical protein J4443_05085 [Candidatus Woesearchaeota archaeon]|nr:hypothetical protein [Candidatus Woesearchaeota archaeon]
MEEDSATEVAKEEVILSSAIHTNEDILEKRKQVIFSFFKKDKNWIFYGIFALIAWFGYWIRTRNIPLLRDVTTGDFIQGDPDATAFLRYAKSIVENGRLIDIDYMRYYPWGFENMVDFKLLSNVIAYFYKFLHFFNSDVTVGYAHVLYPPVAFVIGLIFFFLLVSKLFDYRIALLSSLLLTIIPPYLFRTISGVGDKEAFGMIFFFAALYFFVCSWKSEMLKKNLIFGMLAGLSTGIMGLVWGGFAFVVTIIAIFCLITFIFLEFNKQKLFSYATWYFIFYLIMIIFRDYRLDTLIGVYYNALSLFTLVIAGVIYLSLKYNLKNYIEKKFKLPFTIPIFIFIIIIGAAFSLITMGGDLVFGQIEQVYDTLTSPFGNDRWQLTVAEAHQPYLIDFINNVGWKFFWIYFLGSILLVYFLLNKIDKKTRAYGLIIYILFIIGFSFSRFSQNSKILNGESFFSLNVMYFGGIALAMISFLVYYIYTYYNDKESFEKLKILEDKYLFVLIWLVVLLVGSRSAIRLLFIFSTIASLLAAYFCIKLLDISFKFKKDIYKVLIWIFLILILINPFTISSGFAYGLLDKGIIIEFSQRTYNQARFTGTGYDQQWQIAGKWVRENVPEDAIFAHWWDYGYWIQTNFDRATVTDGGNAKASLNHYMGRYGLTGQNEIEALEFFKAHNVTNFLIVSDEIGKYPAFSSIGSDENWDRYSWLSPFQLDPSKTQETRDSIVYIYIGVSPIDWDFTYKGELFPKGGSAIIGFFIPVKNINGTQIIDSPQAIVVNNGQQKQVPLECVFINGQEINFEQSGLKGCLMIIPSVNGNNVNAIGASIYVSEKVRRTNFAQLYLFGKRGKYFKLAYSDEDQIPLTLYNGRIIGPLKIWEVSYPPNLDVPEHYYKDILINPNVTSLEGRY